MVKDKENEEDLNQLSLENLGVLVPVEELPDLPSAKKGTAVSSKINYKNFGHLTLADYEIFAQLPSHPFWSQVEKWIDFSFADELCAHLYSPNGQRPYAPSLKLKIHLVQVMENLSDREMEIRLMFDMAIKRFIGVPMSFTGFDHSTIGLDRERMGAHLFHACFHYILAQAKQHGLWGKDGDRWLADAFHTHARAIRMGAQRLVFHGMLNIVQHLKRSHRPLFDLAVEKLKLTDWFERLPLGASPEEHAAAFSLLVTRAYTLLSWFESREAQPLFWQWNNQKGQLRSLELQAVLYEILQQNTQPTKPSDPSPSGDGKKSDQASYEKTPRKERPQDRIVNAHDPDVRTGFKTASKPFTGDKIQVVESDKSGFILEIEPIPGNEQDGDLLPKLVETIMKHHGTKPEELVADSVYGYAKYRIQIQELKLSMVSPFAKPVNPSGLLGSEHFSYDSENKQVTCPEGHTTSYHVRNNKENGSQFKFEQQTCAECPLRLKCTKNKNGRTFFVSDYYDMLQEAKLYNETEDGKVALAARYKIERTNNELANHHELRRPHGRGRNKLRITVKLKGIAINVKKMVKALGSWKEDPFVRQPRRQKAFDVCA